MNECANCDKNVITKEFMSTAKYSYGKVLTTVEHEDGLLFCGSPFDHEDHRVAALKGAGDE